jgi:hypothetical protein
MKFEGKKFLLSDQGGREIQWDGSGNSHSQFRGVTPEDGWHPDPSGGRCLPQIFVLDLPACLLSGVVSDGRKDGKE